MPGQRSPSDVADVDSSPPWLRLVDGSSTGTRRRPPTVRRVLARFVAANLVVATVLLAGSLWAGHRAARSESLTHARETTDLLGRLLVEPNLSDGVLTGDPVALSALDDLVDEELRDADVVRMKIWAPDATVVYSDDPRLIGRRFSLGEEQLRLFQAGGTFAQASDLRPRENVFEREQEERLLEVYRPITTPTGDRLLLEMYFPYDQVTSRQWVIWLTFAPISAAVLVGMLLVQLPLARRLIRQVREGDAERLTLHARAADASTQERRRIAGSLHDGVVQDLSAASLFMTRADARLRNRPGADAEDRAAADDLGVATSAVRQSVASLRSLLIEIYPPHLARAGLPAALADLATRAQARGVRTRLDLPDDLNMPTEVEALLFRITQEALQNTIKHARAGTVDLTVRRDRAQVTMEIRDDGVGFDPSDTPASGHFGMRVLTDLVEAAGATLDLATAPGRGTALCLRVPLPS